MIDTKRLSQKRILPQILSDMNIAERRAPQDGRFLVKIADSRIDLRVSTLPTQYGHSGWNVHQHKPEFSGGHGAKSKIST
jgi:Type II/IV secretion system protein